MGVEGFVVTWLVGAVTLRQFGLLSLSEKRRGREGSGSVATVALVRTKRHSRGSRGDKNPATRINNNNNRIRNKKIKGDNLPVGNTQVEPEVTLLIYRTYFFSSNASTELCCCFSLVFSSHNWQLPSQCLTGVSLQATSRSENQPSVFIECGSLCLRLIRVTHIFSAMTTQPQMHTQTGRCYGDVKCKMYKMAVVVETSSQRVLPC